MLFLDLNSYFASCEQQESPELRGKPVVVAPVDADTTVAIAASYEAKRFGIKTGTQIGEAKRLCPDLIVVPGRPPLYVHFHELVKEVAESVLPIDRVCSIDEMRFRLIGKERDPGEAREIALRMKRAMREGVGECLTCSIGIAPNAFLAKLGTEMQKPDGLVILQKDDLPERLLGLKLTDFTGINRKMQARLNAAGIFSPGELFAASTQELRKAFGSVVGERWWYLLRGYEMELPEVSQKSLGHSNVLSPELRTDKGCRDVMLRLIQKATARMRANGLCAKAVGFHVAGMQKSWQSHVRLDPTNDTITINEEFLRLWETRDFERPLRVGLTFTDLVSTEHVTPSLFEGAVQRAHLNQAVDRVNQKFGKNTVYLAGMQTTKDSASEKIAFNKVWLFSEGKGDNEWDSSDGES